MQAGVRERVMSTLFQVGCRWVEFEVPVSKGRARAGAVGFILDKGKRKPAIVVEIMVGAGKIDQLMTAAEVLKAPYCATTDGSQWVWYVQDGKAWKQQASTPKLGPQQEIRPEEFTEHLWLCADRLRAVMPWSNIAPSLFAMLYGVYVWREMDAQRTEGLTELFERPLQTMTAALTAQGKDLGIWSEWSAWKNDEPDGRIEEVARLIAGLTQGEIAANTLYDGLYPLLYKYPRERRGNNPEAAKVIAALTDNLVPHGGVVLDPACGMGTVLAAIGLKRKDLSLVGSDSIPGIWKPAEMILDTAGSTARFAHLDILENDPLLLCQPDSKNGYDLVFIDPPFGYRLKSDDIKRWFELGGGSSVAIEVPFLEAALGAVRPGGYLVALLPPGVLFRAGDQPFRDYLLRESYPEAIIELPSLWSGTHVPTVLVVAKKKGAGGPFGPNVLMGFAEVEERKDPVGALTMAVNAIIESRSKIKQGWSQ